MPIHASTWTGNSKMNQISLKYFLARYAGTSLPYQHSRCKSRTQENHENIGATLGYIAHRGHSELQSKNLYQGEEGGGGGISFIYSIIIISLVVQICRNTITAVHSPLTS